MAGDSSTMTLEERRLALDELKEQHDHQLRTRELDLKGAENSWVSRLFTPLTTTIFAGILTLGASVVGTLMQGRSTQDLEVRKEQHELILKMISVGDEKQARANLKFLADAKLIDADLAGSILALKDAPVLPSTNSSLTSGSRAFEAVRTDDDAIDLIVPWEGGFASAGDPATATNGGVTLKTLSSYLGRDATIDELRDLPLSTVKDLYRRDLAFASGINVPMVRAAFLNLAVWNGPRSAMQTFQAAAGKVLGAAVTQDGLLGRASIAQINSIPDPNLFVETANCLLLDKLKANPGWRAFGPRWLQRLRAFSPVTLQGACPDLQAIPVDPTSGAAKPTLSVPTATNP